MTSDLIRVCIVSLARYYLMFLIWIMLIIAAWHFVLNFPLYHFGCFFLAF